MQTFWEGAGHVHNTLAVQGDQRYNRDMHMGPQGLRDRWETEPGLGG